MKKFLFSFPLIAIVATIAGAALANSDQDASTLNQISGYRQWTRVNSQPIKIETPVIVSAGSASIPSQAAV